MERCGHDRDRGVFFAGWQGDHDARAEHRGPGDEHTAGTVCTRTVGGPSCRRGHPRGRRPRERRARSHDRSVRRLLPVRVRWLDAEPPDPRRSCAVGARQRARRAHQNRDQDAARGGGAGQWRGCPGQEARRLLCVVHGRGGDREGGYVADQGAARPGDEGQGRQDLARRGQRAARAGLVGRVVRDRARRPQGLDDQRHVPRRRGPGLARPRLLREARARELPGRVHRARRQDADARRDRPREGVGSRRGRGRDRDRAREADQDRDREARPPGRLQPERRQGARPAGQERRLEALLPARWAPCRARS